MAGETKLVTYRKGAYIAVEGEKSKNSFYIVKSGRAKLTRSAIPQEISTMVVSDGDFFEVESALSGRGRLFNALAITDCSVIVVDKSQFYDIIKKQPSFAQKIILQFSQKMRKLDHVLAQLSSDTIDEVSSIGSMIKMGDYYADQLNTQIAGFIYHHYIKMNPGSLSVEEAKVKLDELIEEDPSIKETFEFDLGNTSRDIKAGNMIFCEGMQGETMYFIQEGSVKICKVSNNVEITLAVIKTGDLFGEMALLEAKPRSANAIATKDCKLLVINNKNFSSMVERQPNLIIRIMTVLAERIWFVYRQMVNLMLPGKKERIYDMLMLFLERKNIDESDTRGVHINVSSRELIRHTGVDEKEGISILKEFIREKTIRLENDSVIVDNVLYVINRASHYRNLLNISAKNSKRLIN